MLRFAVGAAILLVCPCAIVAGDNADKKKDELKARYGDRVAFSTKIDFWNVAATVADVWLTGGSISQENAKKDAVKLGLDVTQLLTQHKFDPQKEELFVGRMVYQTWAGPQKLGVSLGNGVFVYIAIRPKSNRADPAPAAANAVRSKDWVVFQTRVPQYLNCNDSTGPVKAVPQFSDQIGASDEMFRVEKVNEKGEVLDGEIAYGDKVRFKTRVNNHWLGCVGGNGKVQAENKPNGNPGADETFTIVDSTGGMPNRKVGRADVIGLKTSAGMYVTCVGGNGEAKATPGINLDERFTLLTFPADWYPPLRNGDHIVLASRTRYLTSPGGTGALGGAANDYCDDAAKSDEMFKVEKVDANGNVVPGEIAYGDKVRFKTRAPNHWLGCVGGNGKVQAENKPMGNPGGDETFIIVDSTGGTPNRKVGRADVIGLKTSAGMYVTCVGGNGEVKATQKMGPNLATSDEVFMLTTSPLGLTSDPKPRP